MNPPDETRIRSSRILVVDDEEVVRSVIRAVLEKQGFYVVEAEDGEQAISLLLSEHFDLLIADKNLPGITGLDVVRRARAFDSRMGIVMVTAFASRESAEEALAIGVDNYLIKPFAIADLFEKVQEALQRRHQRSKLPLRSDTGTRPRMVMVCDPVTRSRKIIEEVLTDLGHRPTAAHDLSQVTKGLQLKNFDALICDLGILNRDDASACFLRSALLVTPEICFVAIARRPILEDVVAAIQRGANRVIYRPVASRESVFQALKVFFGEVQREK